MRFVGRIILSTLSLGLLASDPAICANPRAGLPGVVLWAWERPEHLDFIDPGKIGVAFLSRSIELSGERVSVHSRMQPLGVPAGTSLVVVVRLSTARGSNPSRLATQTNRIIGSILEAARIPGCRGVQIDFDAKKSERPFYRTLLTATRNRLPDSLSLSITALSSWCLGDDWIGGLPLDDAVPMLFRIGPERSSILHYLAAGGDFSAPVCRNSVGLSLDEPLPPLKYARRIYAFSPHAWTRESVRALMKELSR